jgi:hypothetical protein
MLGRGKPRLSRDFLREVAQDPQQVERKLDNSERIGSTYSKP